MSVSAPRFVKCFCQYCNGHIEFDAIHAGEMVACPQCGLETMLYVPQMPLPEPPEPKKPLPPSSEATKPTAIETSQREQLTGLYYYKSKDATKGPYTLEQLRGLWMNGQITADALYRGNDSSQWLPLRESPVLSAGKTGGQISPPIPPLRTVQNLARNGLGAVQKLVLVGGLAVMLLTGLFPPCFLTLYDFNGNAGPQLNIGCRFILSPLHPPKAVIEQGFTFYGGQLLQPRGTTSVNVGRLLFTWTIEALATAVAVGVCGLRKS
jgi:hypothetical protein